VYFTVREASQLMGLSQSTIRRRIAAGKTQARKATRAQVEVANGELLPQAPDVHEERLGAAIERMERLMRQAGDEMALAAYVRNYPPKRRNLILD
jgi:excisionase family DNA binding protein